MENQLTIERLRTFPGFENTLDEEAFRIVTDINKLADVAIRVYMKMDKEKKSKSDVDQKIDL